MIKLIASDLDGTFFHDDHKAPQKNLEAIKKFQDAGYEFVAVTGRDYPSLVHILDGASLGCECIAVSGAEIRDKEGNVISSNTFSYELLEEIESLAKPYGVHIAYYAGEGYYTIGTEDYRDEFLVDEIKILFYDGTPEEIRQSEIYQKRVEILGMFDSVDAMREVNLGVTKVFAFHRDNERIEAARKALSVIEDRTSLLSAFPGTIEIIDLYAQKGPVLKKYAADHGYAMEEVAVVGDSPNDLSMFAEDFGTKVVVANGFGVVKDIATHITKSNEEDGVAYLIEKILADQLDDLRK